MSDKLPRENEYDEYEDEYEDEYDNYENEDDDYEDEYDEDDDLQFDHRGIAVTNEERAQAAGVKFPVAVRLVGTDGNAFAILSKVQRALEKCGATREDVKEFLDAATAPGNDYNDLLRVVMDYVEVY